MLLSSQSSCCAVSVLTSVTTDDPRSLTHMLGLKTESHQNRHTCKKQSISQARPRFEETFADDAFTIFDLSDSDFDIMFTSGRRTLTFLLWFSPLVAKHVASVPCAGGPGEQWNQITLYNSSWSLVPGQEDHFLGGNVDINTQIGATSSWCHSTTQISGSSDTPPMVRHRKGFVRNSNLTSNAVSVWATSQVSSSLVKPNHIPNEF